MNINAFNIRWMDSLEENPIPGVLPETARVRIRGRNIKSISPDEAYDLWFAVVQEVERQHGRGSEVEDLDYEIL